MVPLYDRDGLPCSRKPKSLADHLLYLKLDVLSRLAGPEDFDVVGVQKWTKLSHGDPVQLLLQILGLSSA